MLRAPRGRSAPRPCRLVGKTGLGTRRAWVRSSIRVRAGPTRAKLMRVKVVTAAAWCGLERSRKVHRSTSHVSVPRSRGAARHPERSRSRRTQPGLCRLPPSESRCGSGEPCPGACRRRLGCAGRTGAGRSEPGETGAARREHGFFPREKPHVWERRPATFSNKPTPNLPGRNRLCCLYGGE